MSSPNINGCRTSWADLVVYIQGNVQLPGVVDYQIVYNGEGGVQGELALLLEEGEELCRNGFCTLEVKYGVRWDETITNCRIVGRSICDSTQFEGATLMRIKFVGCSSWKVPQ